MNCHNNLWESSFNLRGIVSSQALINGVLALLFLLPLNGVAQLVSQTIVISQVYGGGGNVGANWRNDYIELFNRGAVPVDISTWSVQYASAQGSSWVHTPLAGTLQPGQYYLVEEGQGKSGGSTSLPSPDALGSIDLDATSGKIALVSSTVLLSGSAPRGASVIDFVGYGAANFASGQPTSAASNTTAVFRSLAGCGDSGNNAADFFVSSPLPRHGTSNLNPCSAVTTAPPQVLGPQIAANGVVSGASFQGGAVSPGELVTIFGGHLGPSKLITLELATDNLVTTELGGTRVFFDGVAAALIYTSDSQVSVVVPYAVSTKATTRIQVVYMGEVSNITSVPVLAATPALFTLDSSGSGEAASVNEDGTINTRANPAAKGSVITLFGTGGGITSPPSQDGQLTQGSLPSFALPVSAKLGSQSAEVLYAGPAPGFVSGLFQINLRINAGFPSGALPVLLSFGSFASNQNVTVYVQ